MLLSSSLGSRKPDPSSGLAAGTHIQPLSSPIIRLGSRHPDPVLKFPILSIPYFLDTQLLELGKSLKQSSYGPSGLLTPPTQPDSSAF